MTRSAGRSPPERREPYGSTVRPRSTAATSPPNWPAWSAGRTSSCAVTSRSTAAPGRCPRSSPTNSAWRRHSACCRSPLPTRRHRPCGASAASTAAGARCSTSVRRRSSPWRVRSPGCGGRRSARSSGPRRRRSTSSRRLPTSTPTAAVVFAYRPRARVLPPPHGDVLDRVRGILDVGGKPTSHGDVVVLEPAAAAQRIVDQLAAWGYLHEPADRARGTAG